MRHTALVTSIALTLMSAFVLGQLFTLGRPTSALLPAPAQQQVEATALTFYDAVNDVLRGGDDDGLRRLLHPAFATRQSGSTWTGTEDDFLKHLDSVRALYPGIQVNPEMVSISDDTVSVSLVVLDAGPAAFAGFEVDPADLFGQLEFVRIERGLVIERWSLALVAGQLDNYSAILIDLPTTIRTLVARMQEVRPESAVEPVVNSFRHLVAIVKSGEVHLDVTSQQSSPAMLWRAHRGPFTAALPIETGVPIVLHPMDAVYIPAGTLYRMWDSGDRQSALIALDFGPPTSASLDRTLHSGIALNAVGDRLALSFGSARLLPGSMLSIPETNGMGLAWVTSGTLDMAGSGGETRVRKAGGNRTQLMDGHAVLLAGETAAAGPGSNVRYQSSGNEPATAWFFSIVPAPGPTRLDSQGANPENPTPIPTPAPPPNRTLS